ncbi:MAG TPA: hypothetical protein VMU89_15245 [Thermomicrobiaceae bacterium]|nr:hypothetical protein [Thermomicrobiaceae bacterium]
MRIIIGTILLLHGLVHLLYVGQSARLFELQAGLVWPNGAWAFARLLEDNATRMLASVSYAVAAIGLVVAGIAVILSPAWWRPAAVAAAAFSAVIIMLFWNGRMKWLAEQGGIGLLIDLVILLALLALRWPRVAA